MADGKQWYNNPENGQPKKPAGKPAGSAGKSGKPGMKPSGNRPVSKQGKPMGKNPQAAKYGSKPASGGKPSACDGDICLVLLHVSPRPSHPSVQSR